jgi:hypothetical protein
VKLGPDSIVLSAGKEAEVEALRKEEVLLVGVE